VFDPALLGSAQNPDGGWGYHHGSSSTTEPTALALLALSAGGDLSGQTFTRGMDWLKTRQRPDGGWSPRQEVDQSTWVTALPLLLPPALSASLDLPRAVSWLLEQSGRESGWVYRWRLRLLGVRLGTDDSNPGWPWYPDTAAWVAPTAITVLALEKIRRRQPSNLIERRCASGRAYLLSRRCTDGGWNHGSTQALGYHGASYPETTGLALLALHGASGLEQSLAVAERHLANAKSLEGVSWLRLGLRAHNRPAQADAAWTPRTTVDLALGMIADAAAAGVNVFLE